VVLIAGAGAPCRYWSLYYPQKQIIYSSVDDLKSSDVDPLWRVLRRTQLVESQIDGGV
jgi:hypothetical protein